MREDFTVRILFTGLKVNWFKQDGFVRLTLHIVYSISAIFQLRVRISKPEIKSFFCTL